MGVKIKLGSDYLRNVARYLRHDDFIDGSVEKVVKYLIRHMSEYSNAPVKTPGGTDSTMGAVAWKVRTERLANENLCEPILLQWEAFLAQEISEAQGLQTDDFSAIFKDMDGFGTSRESYVRNTHRIYLGYGQVGMLVEGPSAVSESAEEARERGERSYAMHYEPWLILRADRFMQMGPKRGKLKEVILYEDGGKDDANNDYMWVRRFWIESQGERYKSQRLKLKGNILHSVDGTHGSLGAHTTWSGELESIEQDEELQGSFDEIPFVILGEGPRKDSVLYSVVERNRELLNKKSAKDTIDYYQAFQRVAFFGVSPEEMKQWSENLAAFFTDPQGKIEVVESGDPASLTADMENVVRNAYLDGLLRVAQRHQLMTKQVQSADSKREDNATFENYLGYVTDMVEDAINQVVRYIWAFERGSYPTEGEYELTLGRDFRIAFTAEELAERSILHAWLGEFGQPGREAKSLLVATAFAEQRILGADDMTEEDKKQELVEAIIAEGKKAEQVTRLRDIARQGDEAPVSAEGELNIGSAIEDGLNGAQTAQ